jgi:phage gpG-like protein
VSSFSLGVDWDFSALDAKIAQVTGNLADVSGGPMVPFLQEAADSYMRAIQARFLIQGLGGGVWAPLTEEYLKRKLRAIGPANILIWSGHLRDSLARGGGDYYELLIPNGIVFGTAAYVAHFHQYGWTTKNGRVVLPRTIIVGPEDPTLGGGVLEEIRAALQNGLIAIIAA